MTLRFATWFCPAALSALAMSPLDVSALCPPMPSRGSPGGGGSWGAAKEEDEFIEALVNETDAMLDLHTFLCKMSSPICTDEHQLPYTICYYEQQVVAGMNYKVTLSVGDEVANCDAFSLTIFVPLSHTGDLPSVDVDSIMPVSGQSGCGASVERAPSTETDHRKSALTSEVQRASMIPAMAKGLRSTQVGARSEMSAATAGLMQMVPSMPNRAFLAPSANNAHAMPPRSQMIPAMPQHVAMIPAMPNAVFPRAGLVDSSPPSMSEASMTAALPQVSVLAEKPPMSGSSMMIPAVPRASMIPAMPRASMISGAPTVVQEPKVAMISKISNLGASNDGGKQLQPSQPSPDSSTPSLKGSMIPAMPRLVQRCIEHMSAILASMIPAAPRSLAEGSVFDLASKERLRDSVGNQTPSTVPAMPPVAPRVVDIYIPLSAGDPSAAAASQAVDRKDVAVPDMIPAMPRFARQAMPASTVREEDVRQVEESHVSAEAVASMIPASPLSTRNAGGDEDTVTKSVGESPH